MHKVLGDVLDKFALVYLDDILVYSNGVDEHENHLRWGFEKLRLHKLYVKGKKCEFGKPQIKYLRHVVGSGQIQTDPEKIAAVVNW